MGELDHTKLQGGIQTILESVREAYFDCWAGPRVRIFDPARRTVHRCTPSAPKLHTKGNLQVPETPITLSIEEAFATLDKSAAPSSYSYRSASIGSSLLA